MGQTESAQNGQLTRAEFATERIVEWVAHDQPVNERVHAILSGKDRYAPRTPGGDAAERVAAFIEMLLFKDDGSTYRAMHVKTHASLAGFEPHIPGLVRNSFARKDFSAVDWQAVAKEVKQIQGD